MSAAEQTPAELADLGLVIVPSEYGGQVAIPASAEVEVVDVHDLLDAGDELAAAVRELDDSGAFYSDRVIEAARAMASAWERGRA